MKKETDICRGRHCTFLMHVHLVFVAKYRRKIFDQDAIEKLRGYFASVCVDFDVELVEMDGESDLVHLLINYPPKLAISSLVKGHNVRFSSSAAMGITAEGDTSGCYSKLPIATKLLSWSSISLPLA